MAFLLWKNSCFNFFCLKILLFFNYCCTLFIQCFVLPFYIIVFLKEVLICKQFNNIFFWGNKKNNKLVCLNLSLLSRWFKLCFFIALRFCHFFNVLILLTFKGEVNSFCFFCFLYIYLWFLYNSFYAGGWYLQTTLLLL